jgi:uncharacterized membrane protein YfcA
MLVKILILVAIGLLTGTVTAISAGSGVTIVVPLLTIFLGYTIHEAIGTSLLVDVIASIIVAYNYYRYGKIDIKSGAWLALGAVIGAQIGSHFASFIPQGGLKGGFSVFIIISGLSFLYRAFGKRKFSLDILKFDNKTLRLITIIAIGLFIGLSTGLFGTGGGATILVQGHIPWLDGIIIGMAAMASGVLFSKVANRASEKTLNIAVGVIFIAIGVAMFFVEGGTNGVIQSFRALAP